jgi:hypothetical protein
MRPMKASLFALTLASSALFVACGGDDAVVGDEDTGSTEDAGIDTRSRDTGVKLDAADTSVVFDVSDTAVDDTLVATDTADGGTTDTLVATDTADGGTTDTLVADTRDGAVADTADAGTTDTADAGATDTADASVADTADGATADTSDAATADTSDSGDTAVACHVVINEVKVAGVTTDAGSGAADEFIEIYNPCSTGIDLAGYHLAYRAASNGKDALESNDSNTLYAWILAGSPDAGDAGLASTTLAPGAFFVVAAASTVYTGPKDATEICASTASTGCLSGTAGSVALRDPSGAIVDAVFWGTFTAEAGTPVFIEGTATTTPAAGSSTGRHPDGHDTNNNSTDFTVMATPTPKATNP